MEVKLKVLGGAKSGLEIPLKKEEFTIGRSSECSLRAGSDAISRKHCMIRLGRSSITIADLKSRNGTYVNGERIEEETTLQSGDEVRVGPLRFEVVAEHGLDTRKRPHVQGVAEAAARAAGQADKSRSLEENIDNWLTEEPASDSQVTHETRSLRLDETQGGQVPTVHGPSSAHDALAAQEGNVLAAGQTQDGQRQERQDSQRQDGQAQDADAQGGEAQEGDVHGDEARKPPEAEGEAASGSGIMKRKDKKEPGKLPTRPKGPTTKDSREAAAEVLRAMTRRR